MDSEGEPYNYICIQSVWHQRNTQVEIILSMRQKRNCKFLDMLLKYLTYVDVWM